EPPVGELVRVETEDEHAAGDEQLHLRDRRHLRVSRHLRRERVRQERLREVGDAGLVEPEVGAADVREVVGCAVDAVRDREERDDERHADAQADRREHGAREAAAEILRDERRPAHAGYDRGSRPGQGRPLAPSTCAFVDVSASTPAPGVATVRSPAASSSTAVVARRSHRLSPSSIGRAILRIRVHWCSRRSLLAAGRPTSSTRTSCACRRRARDPARRRRAVRGGPLGSRRRCDRRQAVRHGDASRRRVRERRRMRSSSSRVATRWLSLPAPAAGRAASARSSAPTTTPGGSCSARRSTHPAAARRAAARRRQGARARRRRARRGAADPRAGLRARMPGPDRRARQRRGRERGRRDRRRGIVLRARDRSVRRRRAVESRRDAAVRPRLRQRIQRHLTMEPREPAIPLRTRLLYGTSRVGAEALGRSSGLWLLYYYAPPSDAHLPTLLPSLVVGVLLTVAGVVAALDDAIVGYFSDRTRTRFGRRIPYIVLGAPLWSLFFVALFTPPHAAGDAATAVYLLV